MRIAYYTWETRSVGGIQRVTIDKVNYLVNLGHDVFLITRDQRGEQPFYPIDSRVKQIDIEIDYQPVHQISNPFKRYVAHQKLWDKHTDRLSKILNNIKVDICVNTVFCEEAKIFPKLKDGSRKILESHGIKYALLPVHHRNGWRKYPGIIVDWLNKKWYEELPSKYDSFVVLSPSHLEQWPKERNIKAIYNMCSINPKTLQKNTTKKNHVIALGRLSEEKNFSSLINIWSKVAPSAPSWELLIVGDGPKKKELEKQILQLNVQNSVHLIGEVSDVTPLLSHAQICALTSTHEGFSLVLSEAQTLGIPAISYDCPVGPRDIIKNNTTGILISPNNRGGGEEEFAQKLLWLINSPEIRNSMSKESIMASERFTQERIMQQWEELFHSLL